MCRSSKVFTGGKTRMSVEIRKSATAIRRQHLTCRVRSSQPLLVNAVSLLPSPAHRVQLVRIQRAKETVVVCSKQYLSFKIPILRSTLKICQYRILVGRLRIEGTVYTT